MDDLHTNFIRVTQTSDVIKSHQRYHDLKKKHGSKRTFENLKEMLKLSSKKKKRDDDVKIGQKGRPEEESPHPQKQFRIPDEVDAQQKCQLSEQY